MFRSIHVRFAIVGVALILSGCQTHQPPAPAISRVSAIEQDRHREVAELLNEALRSQQASARTALLLAAADASADDIVQASRAIEDSRAAVLMNLRNADTIGYKTIRAVRQPDGRAHLTLDCMQGELGSTGRNLDVAIEGEGFFKVAGPDGGDLYTRNGNFFMNREHRLVMGLGGGYELRPPITLPGNTTDISIATDGKVNAITAAGKVNVGQIRLTVFLSPNSLAPAGPGLYSATPAAGEPTLGEPGSNACGQMLQGFLESSNVDLIRERLRLRFLSDWSAALDQALRQSSTQPAGRP